MTQANFGSFAEWAIVNSAPLFVSGWSICIQAISTNTTKRHPQTATKTLSYNRKVSSCKKAHLQTGSPEDALPVKVKSNSDRTVYSNH